jgi:hypothetical protein
LNLGVDISLIKELPCYLLGRTEENHENLSHDSPRPSQDSSWAPPTVCFLQSARWQHSPRNIMLCTWSELRLFLLHSPAHSGWWGGRVYAQCTYL